MPESSVFGIAIKRAAATEEAAPVEGDNIGAEGRNDTHDAALGVVQTSRGTGDGEVWEVGDFDVGERPLKIADILERFAESTRLRLKDQPRRDYERAFRRFAAEVGLAAYTRRQLQGPRAKSLLLQHVETIPKPSRRWVLAALKSVWTLAMNLPWPIDPKRDIGRFPKVQRRKTPPDLDIRSWAEAIRNERDLHLKLLGLLLLQFGWRPGSQIAHLKWRNVEYDSTGRPFAIVASGVEEDFKTDADIRVWLPPNVAEALEAWKKAAPDISQEKPILMWRRHFDGRLVETAHTAKSIRMRTEALAKKWGLPRLSPVAFRHWVASALRRSGLSVPASAYWMGHDPTLSGAMRDVYDNPEDCFAEQSSKLPNGPMALLEPPEVSVSDGLSPEIVAIVREYQAGRIGTIELANRMEALRLKNGPPMLTK